MPLWPCANCHKNLEKKDLKRCGQCGIVMYCSKECQKEAWKTGHKRTCESHVQNKIAMDPGSMENPRREKLLSQWLNIWRGLPEEFTMRALDLANHKGEQRTKTHCFVMIIEETHSPNVARAFRLRGAMVIPCSKVIEAYPGSESLMEDAPGARGGMARVRWVMTLYNPEFYGQGKSTCRCRVWEVVGLEYFYEMDQEISKQLADCAQDELKYLLENGEPEEVRRKYRCR